MKEKTALGYMAKLMVIRIELMTNSSSITALTVKLDDACTFKQ
jgi:hypothetical protein